MITITLLVFFVTHTTLVSLHTEGQSFYPFCLSYFYFLLSFLPVFLPSSIPFFFSGPFLPSFISLFLSSFFPFLLLLPVFFPFFLLSILSFFFVPFFFLLFLRSFIFYFRLILLFYIFFFSDLQNNVCNWHLQYKYERRESISVKISANIY